MDVYNARDEEAIELEMPGVLSRHSEDEKEVVRRNAMPVAKSLDL